MTGAEWARRVAEDEPHGLHDLEERVLGRGGSSPRRANPSGDRSATRRAVDILGGVFVFVALVGPIAGATVFFDRSDRLYQSYDFSADFAFTVAAVGFSLGAILQVSGLVSWWKESRRRDAFTLWFSVGVLVCAVLALRQASGEARSDDLSPTAFLIPVWAALALAVVTIGVSLISRPPDAADEDDWQDRLQLAQARLQAQEEGLADLPPMAQEALLADRRRALEILVGRGLLTEVDVDELARRPLGELAERQGGEA